MAGDRLRHTLAGEAIRAGLGPVELAAWHRRLAAALEPEDVGRDRVARHFAAAGEAGRAAALARPAAAALQAQGATRRAFECYRIALRAAPTDADLHADAARTAARLGEYDAMREWLATAERLYPRDRAARLLLDPVFDYLPIRRSSAAKHEPVERLLAPRRRRAATARRSSEAVETARARGDAMALARAARLVGAILGEFERAAALLDEALAAPRPRAQPGDPHPDHPCDAALHPGLHRGGDRRAAAPPSRSRACRADDVAVTGRIALGDVLMQSGCVDEGADTMLGALAALPGAKPLATMIAGWRRFERGDDRRRPRRHRHGSDEHARPLRFDPLGRTVIVTHVLAGRMMAESPRRPPGGRGRDRAPDRRARATPLTATPPPISPTCSRAPASTKRRRGGSATSRASPPAPACSASEAAVKAFAAPAEHRFRAAAELLEHAPRAIHAAELWCEAGALERARRLCEEHGLTRVARRLEQPPVRLGGLTRREREVVLLAAEGLSNRAIGARLHLAEGTVRNYLSTACAKLGVSRRSELGPPRAGRLSALARDQLAAQDLPDRVARHRVDHDHVAQVLPRRQPQCDPARAARPGGDLAMQGDVGDGHLAELRVRPSDHRGVGDGGMEPQLALRSRPGRRSRRRP